jgi:hypothetical protein
MLRFAQLNVLYAWCGKASVSSGRSGLPSRANHWCRVGLAVPSLTNVSSRPRGGGEALLDDGGEVLVELAFDHQAGGDVPGVVAVVEGFAGRRAEWLFDVPVEDFFGCELAGQVGQDQILLGGVV